MTVTWGLAALEKQVWGSLTQRHMLELRMKWQNRDRVVWARGTASTKALQFKQPWPVVDLKTGGWQCGCHRSPQGFGLTQSIVLNHRGFLHGDMLIAAFSSLISQHYILKNFKLIEKLKEQDNEHNISFT